jgi:hypothetical protein
MKEHPAVGSHLPSVNRIPVPPWQQQSKRKALPWANRLAVLRPAARNEVAVGVLGSCENGPVTGLRSGTMRKNCSRSMKNGSSRGPANS